VRLVVPGVDEADPPPAPPDPLLALTGERDLTVVLPARSTAVEGRVLSRVTGQPLPSYEVSFIRYWHGLVPQSSETLHVQDEGGRFRHRLVGGGPWAVELAAPGHAAHRTPVMSDETGTWDVGTVRLGPGGRLSGVLRDARGAPVAYARVYLLGAQMQTHRPAVFTDAAGIYDGEAIAPGSYTAFFLSPRHPLGIVRGVEVREEETTRLDVTLDPPSPVTVIVVDESGRPVCDADVSYTCEALMPLTSRVLRSYEPPGWGGHRTDGQGRLFKHYFPATRVLFTVRAEGFLRANRVVELSPDQETVVEIRLERQR
jgi:hypothetical protein